MKNHNFAHNGRRQSLLKAAFLSLTLLFAAATAFSQANAWVLNPSLLNFGGPIAPFSITAPTPYVVENSVFWNGKLQFYASDGWVYDAAGNQAGQYAWSLGAGLKELAIAPGPGSCNTWCLFWLEASPLATLSFRYQEVVVDQTTGAVSFGPYGEVTPNTMFGTGGIAVSKVTGGTGERDIFVVTNYAVNKFHLSGLGISYVGNSPYTQGGSSFICEADISPDGQYITWGANNKIYKMSTGLGPAVSVTVGKSGSKIQGVEFSDDNQYIYFCSSEKGLGRWEHNVGPIQYVTEGGGSYTRTQLELAKDGYIYAVRDDGTLSRIQNLAVQAVGPTVYSDVPPPTGGSYYGLPDQVDGEDYNQWVGVPPVAINSYQVNGQAVYDFIDATHPPLLVYNCAPINLETVLGGIVTDYTIEVYSTDPVSGLQITGPGYLNYTGSFTGVPPSSIDLRCLPSPGCALFNASIAAGHFTFAVRLTISNRCGSVSRLGHIIVFDAPVPSQVGLQVNNTQTGIPCPASHNISAPCTAGIYSASINLSNSQGDISYYQLTIDEVACGSGTVISNIYTGQQVSVNGVSSLTALGLNALQINGNTGFFADAIWLYRCLKITAVVGNACGSSTDYSYLYFNGQYFDDPGPGKGSTGRENAGAIDVVALDGLAAFPNPFSADLRVGFSLQAASLATLTILDAAGREVAMPFDRAALEMGQHLVSVATTDWPTGLYTVRLSTQNSATALRAIKIQ